MRSSLREHASTKILFLGIFAVSLLLAGVVSFYASGSPDGLESVAEDQGFSSTAEDSATSDGALADYEAGFVDDERASVGVAGVVGVLLVLVLGSGIAYVVARRTPDHDRTTAPGSA